MNTMTKTGIMKWTRRLGLCADATSPGDGIRRYEFFTPGDKPYTLGRSIGFCLGAREAELFLRGYEEGRRK